MEKMNRKCSGAGIRGVLNIISSPVGHQSMIFVPRTWQVVNGSYAN